MLWKSVDESSEPVVGRQGLCKSGAAKISRISRQAAKSGCACERGGWGRISDDGPGQDNPDWSEGPWGRAAGSARTEVFVSASSLTQSRGVTVAAESTKGDGKPVCGEGLV
jgi:hypothetical protein